MWFRMGERRVRLARHSFRRGHLNPRRRRRECGLCLRDDGENGNVGWVHNTGQRKKAKIAAAYFDGTFQSAPKE